VLEPPLLQVTDLQTHFFTDEGVVRAVDGASFALHAGETLGVVGESGCGKSVMARSVMRLVERPGRIVGGQIVLQRRLSDGRDMPVELTSLPEDGREMRYIRGAEIALVFQEPMSSFSPVHTIGDQMTETIRLHWRVGQREARQRAVEMLRRVGISRPEARVDEYSYQLSGGLRQRAMIATALACDPRLLIADEPTTALDVTTQAQILELMRQLRQQHDMAVMLITHNLGVVAEMADNVVVMYLGRVVERSPVDAIFHAPKHPYTQALLRSIPSIDAPSRVTLPTIAGSIPHPYNRPRGCPFHPRCPSRMRGVCDRHEPALLPVGDGQAVSCFLYHPAPADEAQGARREAAS
jgi:peptide/nickel transport system ATP-binding protein